MRFLGINSDSTALTMLNNVSSLSFRGLVQEDDDFFHDRIIRLVSSARNSHERTGDQCPRQNARSNCSRKSRHVAPAARGL